jgi:Tol biopolymer transport system component
MALALLLSLLAFDSTGATLLSSTRFGVGTDGAIGLALNYNAQPVEVGPPNDDFVNAEVLNGNAGSVGGTNAGATLEAGEPQHMDFTTSKSVWYKWQAPAENVAVNFDTFGSGINTVLAIYTGSSLSDLTQVANDNDADDDNTTSRAPFHAVANTTYYIAVASFNNNSAGGNLALNWSATPEPIFTQTASHRLVYEKDHQIYIVNTDGTSPTNLSRNTADEINPDWTPDASKVLFNSDRNGTLSTYAMNADGSDAQVIGGASKGPVLSPDGTRIAYIGPGTPEGIEALYVMNADGSNQTRLTFAAGLATDPVWSPDSSLISYRLVQSIFSEIHIISPNGAGDHSIAGSGRYFDVTWSRDSSKITYTNRTDGEIYIVAADGSVSPANLTNNLPGFDTNPVWSSDGSQIAFLSDRDSANGNSELFLMNADGSNQRRVTNDGLSKREVSWSPDNLRIAYIGQSGDGEGIYAVNTDGTFLSRLTTTDARHAHIRWEPIIAPPPATAELTVWGVTNPRYVAAGSQVTYTFYLFNYGPSVATDATFTGQFPAGVTLNSINDNGGGGTCSGTPGSASFNCTFPTFNVYETKMVNVTATSAVAGAPYTPVATNFNLTSTTLENNTSDNSGTIEFLIAAPALPAPTPGPTDEEQFAYMKFDPATSQSDIFRQRVDGAELLNLTNDSTNKASFLWSPDGSRMAVLRYDYPNLVTSLSVMNADGSNVQVLTNVSNEYIDNYVWSPDGSKLVFNARPYAGDNSTTSDIYVINADGTNRINLTGGDGYNTDAKWSPDGTRISYQRSQYNPDNTQLHDLYVMNANGTNRIKIPHADGVNDSAGVWSPNGSRLAFTRYATDQVPNLYTVQADGSNLLRLTNDANSNDGYPQWSPNGSKLLFSSYRPDSSALEVVNADGSGRTIIFSPPPDGTSFNVGNERWSPDSTKVMYQTCDGECQHEGIYIVNADGTGRYQIGEDREQNIFADWSPDGSRLAFTTNRNGVSRINVVKVDGTGRVEVPGQSGFYGTPKWRPRPQPNTPAGTNVTVTQGTVSVTFSNVTTAGTTTVTPIDPNSLTGVPGEYVINANSLAFEIHTTATYTGPITIGFQVPGITNPSTFSTLRVLHGEPPPVPNFVDRTVLSPNTPAPDFATRTIYARVTSLSPFVIAERVSDTTPPATTVTLNAQPNAAGWHKANVTVTLTATDNAGGSGVQSITYSASGAQAIAQTIINGSTATIPVTTEGTTTITYRAKDVTGNVESIKTITIKLDKTAPVINITSPTAQTYTIGQAVTTSFSCADATSGAATCVGTTTNGAALNIASVGAKTFTVNATDVAGNTAQKSVNYTVAYGVNLLFDQTKANKSGSTIPIKLELVNAAGVNQSASSILVSALSVVRVSDNAPGALAAPGNSNPDLDFKYASGSYQFNLKTTGYATGTYLLSFKAGNDPVIHTVQFQLK